MGLKSVAVAITAIVFVGGVLAARDVRSAQEPAGRYSMAPAEGGFVRLDTQTGAMSLCARKNDQWSCESMADSQQLLLSENERLTNEIKSLKEQIKGMEEVFGLSQDQKPSEGSAAGKDLRLPSEQDVDQAFDYLERMMKKFRERMKKLEDSGKDSTPL